MRFLLMPRFSCCCLLLFLCSVQAQPAAADSGPLSVEAMWQLQRVGDPDLSPDGKLVVVPVTRYDVDKNKGFSDLWLMPTAAGPARQLTSDDAQDNEPRFSPDGKWIAFVSKRGEDKDNQLYVIAIDGGEARRVTRIPTGVSAPKWFPDSKRIAFITSVWPDLRTVKSKRGLGPEPRKSWSVPSERRATTSPFASALKAPTPARLTTSPQPCSSSSTRGMVKSRLNEYRRVSPAFVMTRTSGIPS